MNNIVKLLYHVIHLLLKAHRSKYKQLLFSQECQS